MRKIFAVNEVIRYSIYVFIISQISQTHSQFDVTPFESHIDDNQAKDPYQSTVYYSDQDLNSTDNNLQSIYQQTENLLYNESSTKPIDQIYPSIQQQNVSDWFTQLLKNSQAGSAAQYFNFSKLSPQLNFSNDSFYKLPINFKVFPDSENITVLNTTLPSDVRKVDAKSIFKDASGFTPYLNNKNEIYSTAPLIDSLAMNKVNNTGILSKFFQSFKNTSKPSISFPSIPNGGQSKPNRPIPNTSTLPADILAKKIAEDGGKNSSKYLGNILGHLGLQDVKTVGNGQPMDLYRLHGNDEHQEFNRSSVNHIPSMFPPTFLPPSQLPPARNTLSNQTNTWVFPLANQTTTVTPNISTITTQPTTVNNSSSQNVLTPPTINSSTTNSTNSSVTNSSTPRINPSFSATATDSLSDVYGEIVYSIVYFVHGSHTPISSYFKDIVNNINYWPEGMNRLTNAGKNEMYQLGKWFRQRYRELTGYYYNASLVTVESGGSDLTLSSAEVMAAGLFPPVGYQVWNQAIRWQPIPVYSIPVESDNVILMTKSCKQYGLQVKDLHTSTEWQQFYDNNTDTFNYLNENIGSNFTKGDILGDLERILNIYEDLQTEENRGLPLPNWTETIYPDQLRSLAGKYIDFAVETRQLQKIKTGPFFQRIIEIMSKKINSSNSTSQFPEILHFYSGNTFGLGSIMKTLGLYNSSIPPYASALIFDLRYKDDEYVITVSYKNSSNDAPNLLIIPDCQPTCWFNDFISITKDLMSNNWDDDCATITLSDLTYTIPILIFGVVIIFILALIVVLLCVKCCKYIRGSKANFG